MLYSEGTSSKKYLFIDSNLLGMLDDMLKIEIIKILKLKRPGEVQTTHDPNYGCYHRGISHSL